jgi:hypothetical protein
VNVLTPSDGAAPNDTRSSIPSKCRPLMDGSDGAAARRSGAR